MVREIILGVGLGAAVLLSTQGYNVIPILFLGGLLFLALQLVDGQILTRRFELGGKGRLPRKKVTFADIGGQEVAKREFLEALEFVLKDNEPAAALGIRPLRGILLAGPPGTGKTLMARAAADHAGFSFVAASGSQFVEMYAGVGAQRVREIFKRSRDLARKNGNGGAIVFIDELDVLAPKRGQHHSHLEYDQTLDQLLVEMDGIDPHDDVRLLVVGATNRADLLDPALLRPGRFDRLVRVDLPDRDGRLHILRIHGRGRPLGGNVDLERISREALGFSGAHLESLVNEAAIFALRAHRGQILQKDLLDALEKVSLGEKLERRPSAAELRRISVHEAGHALVSEHLRPGSVSMVTVASRGQALGYVRQTPRDEQYLLTPSDLRNQIAVCLGGAVAEEMLLGDRSTACAADFESALENARQIVYSGLSELGVVSRDSLPAGDLHRTVQELLKQEESSVRVFLETLEDVLEKVATALLENEGISGDELRLLLAPKGEGEPQPAAS